MVPQSRLELSEYMSEAFLPERPFQWLEVLKVKVQRSWKLQRVNYRRTSFMGQEQRIEKLRCVIQKSLALLQRVNGQLPFPAEGNTIFLVAAVRIDLSASFPYPVCAF
jgi:hypothetical protein